MTSSFGAALLHGLARLSLLAPIGRFIITIIFHWRRPIDGLASSPTNRGEGIRVIACGFSRSGTLSLKLALDHLGFKCYHAANLFLTDWGRHDKLWLQAATDEKWNDWSKILRGYKAIADFPAACFYKRLMSMYPDAKVILNVRDPEGWHRSCKETLFRFHRTTLYQLFSRRALRKFSHVVWWQGKFEGKFEDKEFAINVYKSHVEEVKRVVPKEKLLVYEVSEGWAPLCNFLQVDVPDMPFPRGNDSLSFNKQFKRKERAYAVFTVVYVGVMSWVVALLLSWGLEMSPLKHRPCGA